MKIAALAICSALALTAADPALLNLVPAEARTIGGLNVDRTLGSPLGQFVLSQIQGQDEQLNKFVTLTGFDPRRDLRELIFAGPEDRSGKGLILARGTFQPEKLMAQTGPMGVLKTTYNGVTVLYKDGPRSEWLAFPDGFTAIAGQQEWVKLALDRRQGGAPLDPKLSAKISEIGNRYDAWFVSTAALPPAKLTPNPDLPPALQSLKAIEQSSGGVVFGSNVQVAIEAVARSVEDATALQDVLKFVTGMVRLQKDQAHAAELQTILNTLDVRTEGNVVKASVSIPQSQIEEFFRRAHSTKAKVARVRPARAN